MIVEHSNTYGGLRALVLTALLFFAHAGLSDAQDCGDCGVGGWDPGFDLCLYPEFWSPQDFATYCGGPPPPPPPPDDCMAMVDMLRDTGCKITTNGAPYASGGIASLRVKAYPATTTGALTLNKSVIVLPGFSVFFGATSFLTTYGAVNESGLIVGLRASGVDVLLVDYGNSADFIQNNAMAVVKLLQTLNGYRPAGAQTTVVGASMGGLVARYSLTYMEHYNLPHNVGTYISFDTPQQGANVPIGLQYIPEFLMTGGRNADRRAQQIFHTFHFLAEIGVINFHLEDYAPADTSSAAAVLSALESPAARQMLINHFASGNNGDPLRHQLYAELDSLGWYPAKTRNVAFTNGRVNGQSSVPIWPGSYLGGLAGTFPTEAGNVMMDFNLSSGGPYERVFAGTLSGPEVDWSWGIPSIGRGYYYPPTIRQAPPFGRWLDGVPGSTQDTLGDVADMVTDSDAGTMFGAMTVTSRRHTFIPTYSALDLDLIDFGNNASANFLQMAGGSETSLTAWTPFDKIYYPTSITNPSDEEHLAVTYGNINQLAFEIANPPAAVVRTRPSRPTLAMSFSGYAGDVILDWSSVGYPATRYEVQQIAYDYTGGVGTIIYSGTSTQLVLPYLASIPGMGGNYRVRACNNSGCSRYSEVKQFLVADINPGPG